ncbi:hypothetical protein JAAARDRAFT_125489 [Jaapia argillacea MUCL 33604]|uniref:Palmitoyltransferase n=1 Tax=Jaapia argillacea MUCL 33604 TaxID=933084 RepID=A0A067QBT0_9AGAM|nr:hypothetical protein JAAARDRAFT_125489 [Jaapia argillacea MUCL 33604]
MPTFTLPSSSTHAGGILPSASFFRPSRPNYYQPPPPLPRPSSALSATSSDYPDNFQLAPLSENFDGGSDGSHGSGGRPASPDERHRHFEASKRMKHSREPLLPIGSGPSPKKSSGMPTTLPLPGISSSRPSISRETSTRSLGGASGVNSTRGRVRDSVDRMEKLLRMGFNLDNVRNPFSAADTLNFTSRDHADSPSPPMDGRLTFETKMTDDDLGNINSPIHSRRKKSISPYPQSNQSRSPSLSRARSFAFIPHPPPSLHPPLSAVPILSPDPPHKPMRNYQLHPSRNRFFFRGKLLTGGDSPWAFIGSSLLVVGISGVWFGTTCVWWWKNQSPAIACVGAYLCLLTISSMLSTAFRDPGILPRNLDPNPPYPASSPSENITRAPFPRDLKVRAGVVRVKYCPTCLTYRPPRSSHCKMCDNCVDGCDHHCQWVNNCIGRRNYTFFFVFLTSAVLTLCMVIVTSAIHLYLLTRLDHFDFKHALDHGAGSAVAFILSVLVIWPVTALLLYHMRLLLLNVTTIEQIRNQAHKSLSSEPAPPNPFSHGSWRKNLISVMCRPAGLSWLDFPGIATEDKRRINPGVGGTWEAVGDGEEHMREVSR